MCPAHPPSIAGNTHDLRSDLSVRGEVSEPGERHHERIPADIEQHRVGVEIQPLPRQRG